MDVAGIAVAVRTPRRPTTYLVALDDSSGAPIVTSYEAFTSDIADLATQLHDTAEAVKSRLSGLDLQRVVLRRADLSRMPNNMDGPRRRLLMEGAVTSAARSVVVDTTVGTGRDTGTWFGTSKPDLDRTAGDLLRDQGLPSAYLEAASAALAALNKAQ